jgi:transposase
MLSEKIRNEVIRLFYGGASLRGIAKTLGLSRVTVARVVKKHQNDRASGIGHPDLPAPTRRGSLLDAFGQKIDDLLARYPDITAVRLLEELTKEGYKGGYTILKERLRELRPRPSQEPVTRFETGPGVQAQMDYSTYLMDFLEEGRRKVHLFGYLLGYSRRRYLHFVESQDFATTIREHVRAFEYLGGVAATCLYDGMKVVVLRYEGEEPIYNPRFLAFATHYGYRPWACRRGRGQTKGKKERNFWFVEKNLLNARKFRSLEHLNEVLAWWLANVADVKPNRETKRPPIELFQEEQPHLLPLPDHRYDTAIVVYRTVNAEGCIPYLGNVYSVPWQYTGEVVPVRILEEEMIVYSPSIKEIARHPLFPAGVKDQKRIDKAHLPTDDGHKRYEVLLERYMEIGTAGRAFLDGMIETRRYGKDEAQRVLALLGTYRREDLAKALERAVRFHAFSLRAIERILSAFAKPREPLESLNQESWAQLPPLLGGEAVKPRTMDEYKEMLEERPEDLGDDEPAPWE